MKDPEVPEHGWRRGVLASAVAVSFPEPDLPPNHVLIFPMADDGTVWCKRCKRRLNADLWARPCEVA